MRSPTPAYGLGLAIAALAMGAALLAGAPAAEARTAIFKDGLGASARVTWDTSGGTLKYYGTVYDAKGDGYHARIFRDNDRSTRRLIASAKSGGRTNFGSPARPLETSLPAHFIVCTYNEETSLRCTDKFTYADGQGDPSRHRRWSCNGPWTTKASTEGWGRGFVISVWPTWRARAIGHRRDFQRRMWQDVQECANFRRNNNFGMNADQLHMMKLQLDCHAQFGKAPFLGGPTWDLEASTPKMSYRALQKARCNRHD
jgi:hypothetical protein